MSYSRLGDKMNYRISGGIDGSIFLLSFKKQSLSVSMWTIPVPRDVRGSILPTDY